MWLVIEATDVISITHKGGWRVIMAVRYFAPWVFCRFIDNNTWIVPRISGQVGKFSMGTKVGKHRKIFRILRYLHPSWGYLLSLGWNSRISLLFPAVLLESRWLRQWLVVKRLVNGNKFERIIVEGSTFVNSFEDLFDSRRICETRKK